jgi:pimeloyl-ACP methyl ester carboxylesterase
VGNAEEYEKLMDFVMEKKPYIPGILVSVMAEEKIARKELDQKIFKDIQTDIFVDRARLSSIHTPTLIIWGADDRVIHVDNAEAFHRDIQGSRKVVLAGLGHLPMIEDPKKTCIAYKEFLATLK